MKKRRAVIVAVIVVMVLCCIAAAVLRANEGYRDIVEYGGKTYELLEYKTDIFTYSYNSNEYIQVDEICPISNEKWDAVYFNGDIFIDEGQVESAERYYSDDSNYNWYAVIEMQDGEIKTPLSLTGEELRYLYGIENESREKTIVFDDIRCFASIVRESKDGFVFGLTTIAQCDNMWYWKTEVMTEDDREYVIPLPQTLCDKLFSSMQ